MLNIPGPRSRYCDGVTRRNFLKIGTFAFGATAFSMADVLRAEARPRRLAVAQGRHQHLSWAADRRTRTCGTSRPRPRARSAANSSRSPPTCPASRSAKSFRAWPGSMDKCVVIRSVVGCQDRHDAVQCMTGWPFDSLAPHRRPAQHRRRHRQAARAVDPSVPPFVGLAAPTQHRPWSDPGQTGFLGPAYAPFKPDGPGMANMRLNGITADQLGDRRRLLASFDNHAPRHRHQRHRGQAIDSAQPRALDVLTSSRLRRRPGLSPGTASASANATATASPTTSSSTALRRSTISC